MLMKGIQAGVLASLVIMPLIAGPLLAQQRPSAQPAPPTDPLDHLTRVLQLTEKQVSDLEEALSGTEPKSLWMLSAALQKVLTLSQKDALFSLGMAPPPPPMSAKGSTARVQRNADAPPVTDHETPFDAMAKALQLTDAQVETIKLHDALTPHMHGPPVPPDPVAPVPPPPPPPPPDHE